VNEKGGEKIKKAISVKALTLVFLCLSTLLLVSSAVQQAHGDYPSSYTDMVGLVPRYLQSGDSCGLYAPLQVLHWFGLLDVTIEDVADCIGHSEGITYLDQIDGVFEQFMPPGSTHEYGGNDDAEYAKNAVKSYLLWGSPVVCCIEAPGHPWWTLGFCNHYVTIVGYDDSLFGGEGGWYIHDTSTWIDPPYYDVAVSYSEFDHWWNHWWTAEPGSNDNRGAVAAILPQGTQGTAWPYVDIKTKGSTDLDDILDGECPAQLTVELTNTGIDQSIYQISESQGRDGVTIEIPYADAEIMWLDTGGFSGFRSLDTGESSSVGFSGPIQPTKKLELDYNSDTTPGNTISAEIHVQPHSRRTVTFDLQGRLTDRDNWCRERSVWINDDSVRDKDPDHPDWAIWGVMTLLPERSCMKAEGGGAFNIIDDDTTPPVFHEQTITPWPVYDDYNGPIVFTRDITDSESSISTCWFHHEAWDPTYHWSFHLADAIDTIPGGFTYSTSIPRSEWINYFGKEMRCYWEAYNGDKDEAGGGIMDVEISDTWPEDVIYVNILDDDVDPPVLFSPVSSGDILECDQNDYLLRISAWDSGSGWCSAYFSYRFSGDADWVTGNLGESGTVPYEYEFYIPRSTWINHLDEEVYWRVAVVDSDNDRPGDGLWAYSPDYYGGKILVARTLAQDLKEAVADRTELPTSAFDGATAKTRENRRNSLLNQLDAVLKDITNAEALTDPVAKNAAYLSALDHLNSLLVKTDGFAERGAADTPGSGYTPDWIITEEGQAIVDPMIRDLIAIVTARIVT
jgi:hypothetical protein